MIPRKLRKSNFLYLMTSCYKPLNAIYEEFNLYFNTKKYELTFNGQVIYLKHILNNRFDETLRRIEIEDTVLINDIRLFNKSEENEITYIYNTSEENPLYIYQNSEYLGESSFTVVLPDGLEYNLAEMKSIINAYKIAGKLYKIVEL